MREPIWLETIPDTDGPSLALSSALRYVTAAWHTRALDDGAAFYNGQQLAKAHHATDADIRAAMTREVGCE